MHGGHGWLINQFLSPYFNHRTDEYGGCLENRVRLAREVLTAVREAVGPGFPIEFRMSGSELFEGGYDLDEGVRIAQAVEDLVDLIHVSAGSYNITSSLLVLLSHSAAYLPSGSCSTCFDTRRYL